MCVHPERDGCVLVPELPTCIRDGRPVLQQLRGERVTHLMRAATVQAGSVQHAVERLSDVGFVEGGAADGRKDPLGLGQTFPLDEAVVPIEIGPLQRH